MKRTPPALLRHHNVMTHSHSGFKPPQYQPLCGDHCRCLWVYLIVCGSVPELSRQLPPSEPAAVERLDARVGFFRFLESNRRHAVRVSLQCTNATRFKPLTQARNNDFKKNCPALTSKRMTFLTVPNFSHSVRRSSRYSFSTRGSSCGRKQRQRAG